MRLLARQHTPQTPASAKAFLKSNVWRPPLAPPPLSLSPDTRHQDGCAGTGAVPSCCTLWATGARSPAAAVAGNTRWGLAGMFSSSSPRVTAAWAARPCEPSSLAAAEPRPAVQQHMLRHVQHTLWIGSLCDCVIYVIHCIGQADISNLFKRSRSMRGSPSTDDTSMQLCDCTAKYCCREVTLQREQPF